MKLYSLGSREITFQYSTLNTQYSILIEFYPIMEQKSIETSWYVEQRKMMPNIVPHPRPDGTEEWYTARKLEKPFPTLSTAELHTPEY